MSLPATDSFTTASDQSLSAYSSNWTITQGVISVVAASDDIRGGQYPWVMGTAYWNADSFGNDQYAQATVKAVPDSMGTGPAVRSSAGSNCYAFIGHVSNSYLYKVISGTETQLASSGGFSVNNVVKITASGTTITCYINSSTTGAPAAQTDGSLNSGYAGVASSNGDEWTSANSTRIDDWEGGNLIQPTRSVHLPSRGVQRLSRPPLDRPFTLNRESPQADGLVFWLPSAASRYQRTLRDLSGNGLNASLGSGNSWQTTAPLGPGYRGDYTVNSYVTIPNAPILDTIKTVCMWFTHAFTTWDVCALWRRTSNAFMYSGHCIIGGENSENLYLVGDEGDSTSSFTAPARAPNLLVWSGVNNSTSYPVYHNGLQVGTLENQYGLINELDFQIGAQYNANSPAYYMNARINIIDVRTYSRVLSPAEIWNLYAPQTRWDLYLPVI